MYINRRYVKSRNDPQLRGSIVDSYSSLEDCDPRKSKDNSEDPKDLYLPCGLIAWSMFNGISHTKVQLRFNRYIHSETSG